MKHHQSTESSYNESKVENQYYSQQEEKRPVKCKEQNTTLSALSPKSRLKNVNVTIESEKQNEQQFSTEAVSRPSVIPVSVASTTPINREHLNKVQTQDNKANATVSHISTDDLVLTNISITEHSIASNVTSECTESLNVNTDEKSENVSRTKSPTPDASSIKRNTV